MKVSEPNLLPYGSRSVSVSDSPLGAVPPPEIVPGNFWNNTPVTPNQYRYALGRLFPFGDNVGPHYLKEFVP